MKIYIYIYISLSALPPQYTLFGSHFGSGEDAFITNESA